MPSRGSSPGLDRGSAGEGSRVAAVGRAGVARGGSGLGAPVGVGRGGPPPQEPGRDDEDEAEEEPRCHRRQAEGDRASAVGEAGGGVVPQAVEPVAGRWGGGLEAVVGAVLAVPIAAVAWGIVQVWDGPNLPARWARPREPLTP